VALKTKNIVLGSLGSVLKEMLQANDFLGSFARFCFAGSTTGNRIEGERCGKLKITSRVAHEAALSAPVIA
jgi:hypothetical protein